MRDALIQTTGVTLADDFLHTCDWQLRALPETFPAAVFVFQGSQMLYVNPAAGIITGFSREEALKMNFWEFIHPDHQELVKNRGMARQADESVPLTYQVKLLTKSGETRWVNFTAGVTTFAGKPAVIGTAIDITDHKQAEEALKKSEARFRAIADFTYDWENWFGPDGVLLWVNPAVERVTGYTVQECMAMPDFPLSVVHEDEREKWASNLAEGLNELRSGSDVPFRIRRKNGTIRWCAVSWQPIYDAEGIWRGYRSSVRDITDRKKAEGELRDSERRYRAIVEDQTELICRWRPDKTHTFVNEAYCRCFGKRPEELLGRSLMGLIPRQDHEQVLKHFAELNRENPVASHEHLVIAHGGEIRLHQWTDRVVFDSDGNIVEYQSVGRDITDRKRAEEELRWSEERFRTVVEASKDAIIAINADGTVFIFNTAAEKMFGHSNEEMMGQPLDRLMPAEYRERHTSDLSSFFRSGKPDAAMGRTLELPAVRKNGTEFQIELSLSSSRYHDQHLVVAIIRDITARKDAEMELRKFKTISDATPHGHAIVDLDGKILYINAAFAGMHGYRPEELLGKNLSMFHTEEQMKRVIELNQPLTRGGGYAGEEVWHKRRDGSVFPTLMDGIVITDESGSPLFLSGMAVDISEQKATEAALRRQALVFESINDGVMVTDKHNLIVEWNTAAERIFGYSREDIIGKSPELLNRPHEAKLITESIHLGILHDGEWSDEIRIVRKDGTERIVEAGLVPLRDEGGEWTGTVAVNRDITEKRQAEEERAELEEQLRHGQKMEAIGTLASGIAHDFKNLLSAISGYNSLAKDSLQDRQAAQRSLGMVESAVVQAQQVTDALLTFARRSPSTKTVLDLVACAEKQLPLLRGSLPSSIKFVDDLPHGTDLFVRADATQLQLVLMCLVINSQQAMPNGGTLTVSVEHQPTLPFQGERARQDSDLGVAVVRVADTGTGMTPEVQARVFDPFFTTKPIGKGTGLGLANAYGIVHEHGGDIMVESDPGQGTCVTFWLPCVSQTREDQVEDKLLSNASGQGEHIALIESDSQVSSVMMSILHEHGYLVTKVPDTHNVPRAIESLETPVHLVVLDLDGMADAPDSIIACIQEILPGVQLLLLSGDQNHHLVPSVSSENILYKPFRMLDLATTVTNLMQCRH